MARVYDRILQQRLSRRRLLAGAGGAALGTAALAACGGGTTRPTDTPSPSAATATPVEQVITKDGILRTSFSQPLPSISPFGASALAPAAALGFTVFDHLWYVPIDTQEVELFLATNIENPDEQGLEIIVTIGEAFFHDKPPVDGRQVLARDVKASFDAFAADLLAPGHDWYRNIMESVTATDDATVVIKQKEIYAWVYHTAGAGSPFWSSILPEETLDPEMFDLARDTIGSGRHFLQTNRSGEFFEVRRHPNWRVPGEPFLAGIDRFLIPQATQREAAFRSGDIDTVSLPNKLQADQMRADVGDRMTITSDLSRSYATLQLNLDKVPAFKDIKVRKAFRLAINRAELIEGVEFDAEGGVPSGPVPPVQTAYHLPEEEAEYFRFAPDEAKQLLEEANFPFEKELVLKFHTAGDEQQQRAELLKAQFERVGLKVRLVGEDILGTWLPKTLPDGDFDMTAYGQLPYDDPTLPLVFFTTHSALGNETPLGRNNMGFYDEEITAAADAVNSELDTEARNELVRDAIRLIMAKEAPMINLYSSISFTARRTWYKDWITGRGSYSLFNGRRWIDTTLRGS